MARLPESQVDLLAFLAGLKHGVNPVLVKAVAYHETGWNPAAVGAAGELGVMQVLPDTARSVGFTGPAAKLADPWTGMDVGTAYLATRLRKYPNVSQAVSAYNAGRPITGNVSSYVQPVLDAVRRFAVTWRPLVILAPILLAGVLVILAVRKGARARARQAAA